MPPTASGPTRRSSRILAAKSCPEIEPSNSASGPLCDASLQPSIPHVVTHAIQEPNLHTDSPPATEHTQAPGDWSVVQRVPSSRSHKRNVGSARNTLREVTEFIMKPITEEERRRWKGWCEVESEPAFFNVMLREFGMEGIKVQEVISLDEDFLAYIPKPIYGLIFLFEVRENDHEKQESPCPEFIWFANQTTSNACASIALLNIVMNLPDIELGPTLQSLKDFTSALDPGQCGYQVCNHDFIRQIHNSFARKMDMLNADLALSNDVDAKKPKNRRNSRRDLEEEQPQPGFHFVAFMPIRGSVWKLDGLEKQPTNLGVFSQDWMDVARPMIEERMQEYEGDQIQFNLLALCKSPLLTVSSELAVNARTLRAVEESLARLQPDWQAFIENSKSESALYGSDQVHILVQEEVDAAQLPQDIQEKLDNPTLNPEQLFSMRHEITNNRNSFHAAILEEMAAIDQDNQRATNRRHDYTPLIYTWLTFLADNGTLPQIVESIDQSSQRLE